jgi:hypothetical protein
MRPIKILYDGSGRPESRRSLEYALARKMRCASAALFEFAILTVSAPNKSPSDTLAHTPTIDIEIPESLPHQSHPQQPFLGAVHSLIAPIARYSTPSTLETQRNDARTPPQWISHPAGVVRLVGNERSDQPTPPSPPLLSFTTPPSFPCRLLATGHTHTSRPRIRSAHTSLSTLFRLRRSQWRLRVPFPCFGSFSFLI